MHSPIAVLLPLLIARCIRHRRRSQTSPYNIAARREGDPREAGGVTYITTISQKFKKYNKIVKNLRGGGEKEKRDDK